MLIGRMLIGRILIAKMLIGRILIGRMQIDQLQDPYGDQSPTAITKPYLCSAPQQVVSTGVLEPSGQLLCVAVHVSQIRLCQLLRSTAEMWRSQYCCDQECVLALDLVNALLQRSKRQRFQSTPV